MRIVWIAHDHGFGAGAELCLWESIRGLSASRQDVSVVVPAAGRLSERLQALHMPVYVVPYRWWVHSRFRLPIQKLIANVKAAGEIAKLFDKIRPDVVITNTVTVPAGAFAARRAGVPHIWYIHEFGREDHGLKFDLGARVSLGIISNYSTRVLVNSLAVRDRFCGAIPEDRLRVLYYAVDVPSHAGKESIPDDPFRLVLVGRMCAGKRQEDAVRALACLGRKGIRPQLSLLGNENAAYGTYLRRLAADLGVAGQIGFVAFTEDPFTPTARAHAALVCSKSEAFGRITIEAMKQGKPVIGADSGGTKELIEHGVTGLRYRPTDAEDLARNIEQLYRNRALMNDMGRNALDWSMRTFNLETHTAAMLSILNEVAPNAARKVPRH